MRTLTFIFVCLLWVVPCRAFESPGCWVDDPCRGRCLKFEGTYDSNDWVDIDDYALPNFQNRTIAVWVKNDGDQNDEYRTNIFSSHSDYRIELSISGMVLHGGTALEFRLNDDPALRWHRLANGTLDINEWHHAAFTIGNRTDDANFVYAEILLDGVSIALGNQSTNPAGYDLPRHEGPCLRGANIGSYNDGERRFVNATLDDFRIYDYNMPEEDVNELCQLEKDGSTVSYKDPNLIIWYKFNETSGYIAEDSGRDKDTHIYHPLHSAANIIKKDPPGGPYDPNNPDIVNFVDYAALADDWLIERMWPEL